jgi:hypothetical protein
MKKEVTVRQSEHVTYVADNGKRFKNEKDALLEDAKDRLSNIMSYKVDYEHTFYCVNSADEIETLKTVSGRELYSWDDNGNCIKDFGINYPVIVLMHTDGNTDCQFPYLVDSSTLNELYTMFAKCI